MNRLFGLALALVNARGGLLLINEFENGLHHSVQTDVWRMIFRLAERLAVQVFATTHSRDSVRSFQEAAAESPEEGVLLPPDSQGRRTSFQQWRTRRSWPSPLATDIEVR